MALSLDPWTQGPAPAAAALLLVGLGFSCLLAASMSGTSAARTWAPLKTHQRLDPVRTPAAAALSARSPPQPRAAMENASKPSADDPSKPPADDDASRLPIPRVSKDAAQNASGLTAQNGSKRAAPKPSRHAAGRAAMSPREARDASPHPLRLEIPFEFASARLRPSVPSEEVERFLGRARSCPEVPVIIEGHTDSIGDRGRNLELSWLRARAVARLLRAQGLPQQRLIVRALGQYQPKTLLPTTHESQRRVEVRIDGCEITKEGE